MTTKRSKGSGLAWFVRRGKVVRGPFSSAKVRHFVNEGKLGVDDDVSKDKESWLKLGQVDEVLPLEWREAGHALDEARDSQRASDRRQALRAIFVSLVLIAAVTVAVVWTSANGPEETRDCNQAPSPGVFLEGCRLAGADWQGAPLDGARLANVELSGARLSTASLRSADLRYAQLDRADLSYANLADAVLLGASVRNADLTNADLSGADLRFADLSGTRLGGADLGGVNLEGALWTDGVPCNANDCPRGSALER